MCIFAVAMEQEIISGVRFFAFALMIILSVTLLVVYQGRMKNRVYNTSRLLLAISTLYIVGTFLAQFVGHYRETQPCFSWALNIMCFSIACPIYNISEVNLLRGGHVPRRTLRGLGLFWTLQVALVIVGAATGTLINNVKPVHSVTMICCILFTIMQVIICHQIYDEMRRTDAILTDDHLQDRRLLLRLTANSFKGMIVVSIIAPWISMSDSLWLNAVLGMVYAPLVAWYLIAFIAYGHNMAGVIEVEDALVEGGAVAESDAIVKEEAVEEGEAVVAAVPVSPADRELEKRVDEWVAQRRFTDPSITINMVSRQMGVTSVHFNSYLSSRYGMTYRNWIPHLRVEYAKELLLENPGVANNSVAEDCGFTSRTVFQRCFSEIVGMPPKQWSDEQAKR